MNSMLRLNIKTRNVKKEISKLTAANLELVIEIDELNMRATLRKKQYKKLIKILTDNGIEVHTDEEI